MTNRRETKVILSFDDIDTLRGGCTTHFATQIVNIFLSKGWKLEEFPRLVRLNPDIPWKTRGNAAISIVLSNKEKASLEEISDIIKTELVSYISLNEPVIGHSQSTYIVADFDFVASKSDFFKDIYRRAIKETLDIKRIERDLLNIIERQEKRIIIKPILGTRGLIGALASIGHLFEKDDYTFELLAYRRGRDKNKKIKSKNRLYSYFLRNEDVNTFGNIDTFSKKIIITPHGPDPVLFGLRGDNPLMLLSVFHMIKEEYEDLIDKWMIFRTNQGTDIHHQYWTQQGRNPLYSQIETISRRIGEKKDLPSGHRIFRISVFNHDSLLPDEIDLACYKESLKMKEILEKIKDRDLLLLNGNIKQNFESSRITLNLEKSYTILLKIHQIQVKPLCPKCLNLLESAGREKGLRCRKCDYKIQIINECRITSHREIVPTVTHEPPMYQRHLTKPLKRFGREDLNKSRETEEIVLNIINRYS